MNDNAVGFDVSAPVPFVSMLVILALAVVSLVGIWKVFTKAGQPGWACLIPIYNGIVIMRIAGRPVWWILLCLIPIVNLIVGIIVMLDIASSFGKGPGFGLGLAFLGFVFFPMLGFSDAQYVGPAARG
jgi:hypothetical protein